MREYQGWRIWYLTAFSAGGLAGTFVLGPRLRKGLLLGGQNIIGPLVLIRPGAEPRVDGVDRALPVVLGRLI